jgi:tRNA/rRNA methyltransferase
VSTPHVVVVLVRAEGPLNVGSVARLCGNFGARLRLVDVRADITSTDAIKMAHPSEDLLAQAEHFTSLHDALHDVELAVGTSSKIASAVQGPVLDVDTARDLLPSGPLALVFGNERTGLALDEAAQCARVMRLPVLPARDSMNLSHAVSCALTIVALAGERSVDTRASTTARDALLSSWSDALAAAGFYRVTSRAQFAPRLQEIVGKMDVSERDTDILRGMFALFLKRLRARDPADSA